MFWRKRKKEKLRKMIQRWSRLLYIDENVTISPYELIIRRHRLAEEK